MNINIKPTVTDTMHVQWCVITQNVHMTLPKCTHNIIPRTKSKLNRCAQILEDLKLWDPTETGTAVLRKCVLINLIQKRNL